MTAFDDLVADRRAPKRWLAVLAPWDPDTEATTAIYLSDGKFTSRPTDTPANQRFLPRLVEGITFERHLVDSAGRLGGRSLPQRGALRVAAGGLGHWWDYGWDGRSVEVRLGAPGWAYDDFGVVFRGFATGLSRQGDELHVALADWQGARFATPVQTSRYAGSGGVEGAADLAGKFKPQLFGVRRAIRPVLLDWGTQLYQLHDGAIEAVLGVWDRAVALTGDGDHADAAALLAASIAGGHFATCLAAGLIRLGTEPDGPLAAAAEGDASGAGYVSSVAAIVERIALGAGGLASGDLDAAAFAALDAANAAPVGLWAGTGALSIEAAFDGLCDSVGATWGSDRAGKLTVRRLEAPAETADARFDAASILSLSREPVPVPPYRVDVRFHRRDVEHAQRDLAAGAADADAAFFAEEWRLASSAEAAAVLAKHPTSEPLAVDTALDDAGDAGDEATRLQALLGGAPALVRLTVKAPAFALELGDTVEVTWPGDGFGAGRRLRLVGITERAATSEADLMLWGDDG